MQYTLASENVLGCLFEIEAESNQLGVAWTDRIGEEAGVGVGQVVRVVAVEGIGEAVAELQLRYQLEERQLEVAAEANLKHGVVAFQLDEILRLAR